MSKKLSYFGAFMLVSFCSVAYGAQQTVRAGSISLNTGVKPATNTSTQSNQGSQASTTNRISSIQKFSPAITPVASVGGKTTPEYSPSNDVLNELKQQIKDLQEAQLQLERNQLSSDDVDNAIASQVQSLDFATPDQLQDALAEIRSNDTDLQTLKSSVSTIQQQAEALTESLNADIDNRLRVRGLIDYENKVPFAQQSDIEPTVLAQKIVADSNATDILTDKLQPSDEEIKQLITSDLQAKEILDRDGKLQVAKTSDISTSALTAKLNNTFAAKGEVGTDENKVNELIESKLKTEKILDDEGKLQIATSAAVSELKQTVNTLNADANTSGSIANKLQGFAKTSDITAESIANKLATSDAAKNTLAGQIGPDESKVNELIVAQLGEQGILNKDTKQLMVAKIDDVSTLQKTVNTLNGNTETEGSLLYRIKNDDKIRDALKGQDGKSVTAADVTTALKADEQFLKSVKGKDGAGFTFQGSVKSYDDLIKSKTAQQGLAWYSQTEKLLYIASCNNDVCSWPSKEEGVPFRGEDGKDGKDAVSAWYAYCTAPNETDKGKTNLDVIIKPLYDKVTSCDDFTSDQYNAIMGGAKAYCLSLAKDVSNLKLDSGIGRRLARTLGETEMNQFKKATTLEARLKVEFDKQNFVAACEAKYNEIMSPEQPWTTYCEAQAENYPEGTQNLTIIQKLYPNDKIETCDDFTASQYAAITGGAQEYCKTLSATFDKVSLNDGVGLKMARLYMKENKLSDLSKAQTALEGIKKQTAAQRLEAEAFGGKSLLQACIDNYNSIMSGEDGKDAEKPEITYCKSLADNYSDGKTLNRDLAYKLFPGEKENIKADCSGFTAEMYAKMIGGAKAYCANLTATFDKVSLNDGVGLKMARLYMKENKLSDLSAAKEELKGLKNQTAADRLNNTKILFGKKSLLDTCIDNYNSIMSGDDAETAWHAYCTKDNNLTNIIKPLYGSDVTCDSFSSDQYNAIMGGAKAYCLSLVKQTTFDLTSGIGKRLSDKLGGKMTDFAKATSTASRLTMTGFKGKDDTSTNFMAACEAKYDEIMSGSDGKDGKDGEDGESAAKAWCKAHTLGQKINNIALTAETVKKLSPAKALKAVAARNKSNTGLTLVNNDNKETYFTSLQACLEAVAADPTLMGGDSAEEAQFNSDVINKKIGGGFEFGLNGASISKMNTRKADFANLIKGQKGDTGAAGTDGKTFVPSISTDGKITWNQHTGSNAPSAPSNFDISGLVETKINTSKADIITAQDLVSLIEAGAFKVNVGNQQYQLNFNNNVRQECMGNQSVAVGKIRSINSGLMQPAPEGTCSMQGGGQNEGLKPGTGSGGFSTP